MIAFRYGGRALDLTRERTFSLSSLTVNQVKALEAARHLHRRSSAEAPRATQQLDRVQQLLDLYKAANPEKVQVDYVDPYRDAARGTRRWSSACPTSDVTQGGGVLIEYGEGETAEHVVVRNTDLFEIPRQGRFDPDAERSSRASTGRTRSPRP